MRALPRASVVVALALLLGLPYLGTSTAAAVPPLAPGVSGQSGIPVAAAVGPSQAAASSPPAESWYNISGGLSGGPPSLTGASMAYNPTSNAVILFGGCGAAQCPLASQTWSFANGIWTNVTPSSPQPPPRSYASMVYDAAAGSVLLFGGMGASGRLLNDTWNYTGGRWTNITTTSDPSPRWSAGIAYDHTDSEVIVFGGCGASKPCMLNDTWVFQAGGWFNATSHLGAAPPARYGASFDWDSYGGYSLLFGGCDTTGCPANDTWELARGAWTQVPVNPVNPPARSFGVLTSYRPVNGSVLIGGVSPTGPLGGAWLWSNGRWVNASAQFHPVPSPRSGEAGVGSTVSWVGSTAKTLPYLPLFGGTTSLCPTCSNGTLRDTWILEPTISVTVQALPSTIEAGELTSFTATASGGNAPYAFIWHLGDGGSAFGPTTVHSYSSLGNETVTVVATDSDGAQTVGNTTVTVVVGPSISIHVAPSATDARLPIQFSGMVSGGRPPFSMIWSFGDFWTSNKPNASHAYANPGQYLVEFTVTDFVQGSAIAFYNVTINPPPVVQVIPPTVTGVVGKPVALDGTIYGGTPPIRVIWNFGDGGTSALLSTDHVYAQSGDYSVRVCATDAVVASSCANLTVQVSDAPTTGAGPRGSDPGSLVPLLLLGAGVGLAVAIAVVALMFAVVLPRRAKQRRLMPPPSAVIAALAAASDEEWEDHRRKDTRYATRRR